MRGPRPVPIVVLAAVCCASTAAQSRDESVRGGRPFSVQCHFRDEAFADQAKKTVDLVWAVAKRHLAPPDGAEDREIIVHVYKDGASYARAGERLRSTVHQDFPGFADPTTMTGHVLLGGTGWSTGEGFGIDARTGIAHEAMHLAVFASVRGSSLFHPEWFTEGIAQWAEGEVARYGGWIRRREQDPYEGAFVADARQQLETGELPKVADMLAGSFGELERRERYPATRMLFVMLMERHREAMAKVLETACETPPSAAFPQILRDTLAARLGAPAWQGLEHELVDFVKSREVAMPKLDLPPADAVGEPGDAGYLPSTPLVRWLADTRRKAAFVVTAKLTIADEGARQADLVFDRRGAAWVRVTFVAGGGVYVTERVLDAGRPTGWRSLAAAPDLRMPKALQCHDLRVMAWARKLRVFVDGEEIVEASFEKPSLEGRWGVGGPVGSRAFWKSARLR